MIEIVLMGLGPVGLEIARLVRARPGLRLAGAIDTHPDLAGRDLAEILGSGPAGIAVSTQAAPVLQRIRPDVVLHATGSKLDEESASLETALQSGASVVSTCEELAYPFYRHPDLARALDGLAVRCGAVLLGTGVNPGFVMDKLPITLLGACRSVSRIVVSRAVDASRRREPLQRKIGSGLTPEEFERRRSAGRVGHVGLAESAHMLADAAGVPEERTAREEIEPVIAASPCATPFVEVGPGRVSGVKQRVIVEAEGRERVRLDLRMALDGVPPVDTIRIEGTPSLEVTLPGGIHGDEATPALVVNCAYQVRSLRAGLRTMLDLPLRGYEQLV